MHLESVGVQQVADTLNRRLRELGLHDNLAEVARDADIKKAQFYTWVKAQTKNSYDAVSFIKLCLYLKLDPVDVLFGNTAPSKKSQAQSDLVSKDELLQCTQAALQAYKDLKTYPDPAVLTATIFHLHASTYHS